MTSSPKVLHLACHCQTHVLRLTDPSFEDVGVCDCSHCLKRRIVWGGAKQGTLEVVRGVAKDGAEDLTEYRFGNKNAGHQVSRSASGISSSDGTDDAISLCPTLSYCGLSCHYIGFPGHYLAPVSGLSPVLRQVRHPPPRDGL